MDPQDFTRTAAAMVAENDRVPAQRVGDDHGMSERPFNVHHPEWHQRSYNVGYEEGGRDAFADLAAAFDELCDVPDGVDIWDPWSVARWVAALQRGEVSAGGGSMGT